MWIPLPDMKRSIQRHQWLPFRLCGCPFLSVLPWLTNYTSFLCLSAQTHKAYRIPSLPPSLLPLIRIFNCKTCVRHCKSIIAVFLHVLAHSRWWFSYSLTPGFFYYFFFTGYVWFTNGFISLLNIWIWSLMKKLFVVNFT